MKILIDKAKKIRLDIPVAAMVTKDGEIIALEVNKKEKLKKITAHAEILAIEKACKILNTTNLSNCELYTTLEPCPMCGYAIINSRIKSLFFGSYDLMYGAFSVLKLDKILNSKINIKGGIKEEDCNSVLKEYFKNLRKKEDETKA